MVGRVGTVPYRTVPYEACRSVLMQRPKPTNTCLIPAANGQPNVNDQVRFPAEMIEQHGRMHDCDIRKKNTLNLVR